MLLGMVTLSITRLNLKSSNDPNQRQEGDKMIDVDKMEMEAKIRRLERENAALRSTMHSLVRCPDCESELRACQYCRR